MTDRLPRVEYAEICEPVLLQLVTIAYTVIVLLYYSNMYGPIFLSVSLKYTMWLPTYNSDICHGNFFNATVFWLWEMSTLCIHTIPAG